MVNFHHENTKTGSNLMEYSVFSLLHKRLPFDWTNPIGYLIAVTIEYIILGYEYLINACNIGLGIGAYWIAISTTKEIQRILRSIKYKIHAKNNQSNDELKNLFSEFIEVHAVTKQLSTTSI